MLCSHEAHGVNNIHGNDRYNIKCNGGCKRAGWFKDSVPLHLLNVLYILLFFIDFYNKALKEAGKSDIYCSF